MAVDQAPIRIDPYTSTVPVPPVQIPKEDLQAPQPAALYSKSAGIATMADSVMKGMLRGLQMKEERKYKTAEAVMQAQDAGIGAAKKNYEDLLQTKGAFEADGKTPKAETQAAYAAWQTAVNAAAEQRQQFAIPEKGAKQQKGQKKDKKAADGAPAAGGFGANLKQFFERNPHIIPELAIIGMKSQVTPYGQMGPEQQKQKIEMDALQRQEANQKVNDAARATYDELKGKSNLTPVEQEKLANATAVLTPIKAATKWQTLVDPQGQQHSVEAGAEIPEGWKVYEKPLASQTPRAGTEQEFTSQALKGYGYTNESAPPALLKYLHDTWAYKAAQTTSTSGEHMETDPTTGKLVAVKTYGSSTRGAGAPKPPTGFSPIGEDGLPQKESEKPSAKGKGRMNAPPSAAPPTQSATGKGRMTPPPTSGVRDTGLKSMQGAQNTQRVETEEKGMYDKATAAYQKALATNKAKAPDKASLDAANAQAEQAYNAAKAQIVLWKAKQVKAIGGDPWQHQAKGPDGTLYGTMDGTNWVNISTGYPYQEK